MKLEIINRKQRELAQRDQMLLDSAHELLETTGFNGLTLEKLAAYTQFSKGTIYNHFTNKEDLLTALCVRGLELQLMLFRKVLSFPGGTRELMVGMHYAYNLYAQQVPALFMCSLSGLTASVMEKSTSRRMEARRKIEAQLTDVLDSLIKSALKAGDIQSPLARDVASVSFGGWAMSFGTISLLQAGRATKAIDRIESVPALLRNISLLLDGLMWLPLSRDFNYEQTWSRLQAFFAGQHDLTPLLSMHEAEPIRSYQ